PDTPYREDALYYKTLSAFKLANNSLEALQDERFTEAKTALNDFEEAFPTSDRLEDLRKLIH
ncbi:outer membrane protein assembly factor BamD, partial [Schleiferiaceae bacterium]|nr:outer membrane protein assembly factor BamD [Schleiferiaceae bacterium]